MIKSNDENEKDEGLNLSDMINEYEEDSALRSKIDALKAEKAQEEAQRLAAQEKVEEEMNEASTLSNTMELPRYSSASVVDGTFLDVDETQEIEEDQELDADKTLVIMDRHVHDDNEESILYYGDHEVDAEEITEEDIQEFLGDDDVKKLHKPMDPKKMNKIVTYVISTIVGICVLVGGGFGIKMAIDAFSTKETTEPVKKEETPVKKEPVKEPVKEPDEKKNAVKIAEINGSIKAKQKQVTDLNTAVASADSEIASMTKEIEDKDGLADVYAAKEAEFNNITNKVNQEIENVRKEEAALAAGTGSQEKVDAAKKRLEDVKTGLKPAEDARNNAKSAKEKKETERDKRIKDKQGYLTQISSIQLEIDNLQKELQTLQ